VAGGWRPVSASLQGFRRFPTFQGFAVGKISRAFGRACNRLRRDEGTFAFDCVQPLRALCTAGQVEVRDRRGDAAGGGGSGEIKAASKLFQSPSVFSAFPKKALAVLWDFKRLQGL
jgi:hypothetical protein